MDLDDENLKDKLAFVNTSLSEIFDTALTSENEIKTIVYEETSIEIVCYFIKPNLDVLLRGIASKPSKIADCVEQCLDQENIKPKEREKKWVDTYMRYDICDSKERENAKEKVTYHFTNSKNAWNLGHQNLEELSEFLNNF